MFWYYETALDRALWWLFWTKNKKTPPVWGMITKTWKPFVETGCICKSKTTEHPSTDESTVEFLQQTYVHSLRKSRNWASRDLAMPHKPVLHTVWKWLHTVQTGQSKTLHSLFSICAKIVWSIIFCWINHDRHRLSWNVDWVAATAVCKWEYLTPLDGQATDRSDFTEVASEITWPFLNLFCTMCMPPSPRDTKHL